MPSSSSPVYACACKIIAHVYLLFCLAPSNFGIDPDWLPTFGVEIAYADSDVSVLPFGDALSAGRQVTVLDQQGRSVRVRYVVTNTAKSALTGVRLGLTLLPGVALRKATPAVDASGSELSVSLGDIASHAVSELVLELERTSVGNGTLDSGAKVFAMQNGVSIVGSTAPAELRLVAGDPSLLASTPEADADDAYIVAQAGKLDHDPARIFAFVRDSIRNEVYSGSLRGARGTLLQGAGSSLDKSSLLIALIRASGRPAGYVRGTLADASAQTLILSMFPSAVNLAGYITPGDQTADPANDPALLAEAKTHTWVVLDPDGNGLQNADPSFASASLGDTFAVASSTFSSVPDSERHKVRIRVRAETTMASLLGGSFSDTETVLEATFNSAELAGRPLHLQHQVESSSVPSPTLAYSTFNYAPYLLWDRTDGGTADDEIIRGTDYQETITSFPFGSQALTGVFLELDAIAPGGVTRTSTKTVFDRIGYDIREHGGVPPVSDTTQPALNAHDITTIVVSTGGAPEGFPGRRGAALANVEHRLAELKPQLDALVALNPSTLTSEQLAFSSRVRELQIEAIRSFTSFVSERFLATSMTLNRVNEGAHYARIYPDSPRFAVVAQYSSFKNNQGAVKTTLDLVKDDARVVLAKGQSLNARFAAGLQRGIAENVAETTAMELPGLPTPISTFTVFQAAETQGIVPASLHSGNAALLETLPLSAQAKARIAKALAADKLVIVPSAMVTFGTTSTVGWYEMDGGTGETIGVLEDGSHGSGSIEWAAVIDATLQGLWFGGYFGFLGFIGGFLAVLLPASATCLWVFLLDPDLKNDFERQLNNVGGVLGLGGLSPGAPGVGDLIPRSILAVAQFLGTVKSYIYLPAGASLVIGFAAGVQTAIELVKWWLFANDPLVQAFKSSMYPLEAPNRAFKKIQVNASQPAGAVQGAHSSEITELRGNISSTWTGPITVGASVSSLSAPSATVTTSNGLLAGSGNVTLAGVTPVPVSIAAGGSLGISGDGALTFHGASTALVGSAGTWKTFTASVSGGSTLTLTTDRLAVNGALLPPGTYTVQSSVSALEGSGAGLATNFTGSTTVGLLNAAVQVGPGSGSLNVGASSFGAQNGYALASFSGNASLSAAGDLDLMSMNGSASHVAVMGISTGTVFADQNTPAIVEPILFTSLTGEYLFTARAPPGWKVEFNQENKLEITPAGGAQSGTFPVVVTAHSNDGAIPTLLASATIQVTVGAVAPGVDLEIIPDPKLTIAHDGAEVPSAFELRVRNLGPAADTFTLVLTQAPAGFTPHIAETVLTVPAGATGSSGLYLHPFGSLPVPGTVVPFTYSVTSNSNGSITDSAAGVFVVPEIHAVGVSFEPKRISAPPGASATTEVTIRNAGNVPEPVISLELKAPANLGISALATPLALSPGETTTQSVTLTPAASVPLNTSIATQFTASFGTKKTFSGVGVEVVVPGAAAANQAALDAAIAGDSALAEAFRALSLTLSGLFVSPNDPVQQGLAIANLNNLISLLGGDEYDFIRNELTAIKNIIELGNGTDILNVIDLLVTTIEQIGQISAALRAHDFRVYLSPSTAISQPNVPAVFQVVIQNLGSQPTTFSVSTGFLPFGVSSSVSNGSVTVQPGATTQLPIVSVTNTGSNLQPFDFLVFAQAIDPTANFLQRSARASFIARTESLQLFGGNATPSFVQAGGFVNISARAIAALNAPRNLRFFYEVSNQSATVIFTSTPILEAFTVDNSLHFLNLPSFDSSFLPHGRYTVKIVGTEENGTSIPGTESSSAFYIGSPVDATLSILPDQVAPGDSVVQAALTVHSEAGLGSGLDLIGTADVLGARGDFVVKGDKVYISGGAIAPDVLGTNATIVDISDPTNPQTLSQFLTGPSSSFVLGGAANDVIVSGGQAVSASNPATDAVNRDTVIRTFSLADPLNPTELTASPLRLSHRQFFGDLYARGNRIYSHAGGYRFFFFGSVFGHWGGVSLVDVTNPAAPMFTGSIYTGTKVDPVDNRLTIEGVSDGFSNTMIDVSSTVIYHATTNAPQNNVDAGPGVIRIFDVTNPASPVASGELVIPNTVQTLSGYRSGNQVLLVSTTGGVSGSGTPNITGHLVLTVLDVTDSLNPVITAQRDLPSYNPDFVTRPLPTGAGKWILGDNLTRSSDNVAVFGFVDTTQPGDVTMSAVPSFPGATSYKFQIVGDNLIVVAPPPAGLMIFSLASLSEADVTATVNVPKGAGVTVLPGSFNIPPSSIVDNGTYETLFWGADKFPLPYEAFDRTITWNLLVTGMKAVEARQVVNDGKVAFTSSGGAGEIPFGPSFVSSGFTLFLDPVSRGAAPGETVQYNLQVVNALGGDQGYALKLVGLDPDWYLLPPDVTVPAGGSEIVPITVTPSTSAALAEYSFTVIATPFGVSNEAAGSVRGSLVVAGEPTRPDGISHGVVVQLDPPTAIAGQAVPAKFRIRVTNTGRNTEQFAIAVNAPGFDVSLPQPVVEVPPGASSFRETTVELTPQVGNTSGVHGFSVTARSTADPSADDDVPGTVTVIGNGVGAFFTPTSAAPGSQVTLRVVNSGTSTDTFTVALAGPAGPFASLGSGQVTIPSGGFTDVPVTMGAMPFARPGSVDLLGNVVSQGNSAARALARANIVVPQVSSFRVRVEPQAQLLNAPGDAVFFVSVDNTGNTEDSYSLEILSASADLTAHLVTPQGDPTSKISPARIPGGSTGGFLLRAQKPSFGEATFVVRATSLTRGGTADEVGRVVVIDAGDLCPADPTKSAPGACGCGTPDADTNGNQLLDCFEAPPCTGLCTSADPFRDDDGDGVSNCTESADKTDACDSGSFVQKLLPISCAGANGYLAQGNIATVINKLNVPLGFRVQYRDATGILRGDIAFTLAPQLKRDLIVSDLGLQPDTYGTVCVTADTQLSGAWSGGLTLYKPHFPDGVNPPAGPVSEYDFALYYPFENPQRSVSALTLNSNAPGTDGFGLVANWVRLTDGKPNDGQPLRGRIRYYDANGVLVGEEAVDLPDGGRFDYPGHERIGKGAVGLAEFLPESPQSEFYFEVSRYFHTGVGAASKNFYTAFTIPRRPLTGAAVTARTPVKANEVSIIELVNGSDRPISASVRLFGAGGAAAGNEFAFLPAKGSYHRILLDISGGATVETAEVSGPPEAVAATTLSYVFDSKGGLQYAYAQPFAESAGAIQFTEFNSFIGHKSLLDLSNSLDEQLLVGVRVMSSDNDLLSQLSTTLQPRGNATLDLGVPADTYGTVIVDSGGKIGAIPVARVLQPGQYVLSFPGR